MGFRRLGLGNRTIESYSCVCDRKRVFDVVTRSNSEPIAPVLGGRSRLVTLIAVVIRKARRKFKISIE